MVDLFEWRWKLSQIGIYTSIRAIAHTYTLHTHGGSASVASSSAAGDATQTKGDPFALIDVPSEQTPRLDHHGLSENWEFSHTLSA